MTGARGFVRKIRTYMENCRMIPEQSAEAAGSSIIAGVSGGADSVCLFRVLAELAPAMGFALYAVHVHHGLRAAADDDEAFVREICARLDVECTSFHVHAAEYARNHNIGTEEAGRTLRYDIFEKECRRREKETGRPCRIAVAHHMEDQAETAVFHLCRGSTITGMGGMRPVSGRIIRPLLQTGRKEIEEYLTQLGQTWRWDESNADEQFTRNYIRRQILPALERVNPNAAEHIGQFAADAAETDAYLSEVAEKALQHCMDGSAGLRISTLLTQPELIAKRILFQYTARMAGRKKDIQGVHIRDMMKLCASPGNGGVSLPYGLTARKSYDHLQIVLGVGKIDGVGLISRDGTSVDRNRPEPVKPEDSSNRPEIPAEISQERPPAGLPVSAMAAYPSSPEEYECSILPFEGDLRSIPLKKYTKWFDYDRIGRLPVFRKRQSGDRITVTDCGSSKKLTRFMIDEKIPSAFRDRMILPTAGSEILWVPGYRISAAFKVREKTQNILQIRWTGIKEEKDV